MINSTKLLKNIILLCKIKDTKINKTIQIQTLLIARNCNYFLNYI